VSEEKGKALDLALAQIESSLLICSNCPVVLPFIMDRDENAARNILARALPQGLRNVKPVEIEPLPISEQARSRKQEAIGLGSRKPSV